MKHAFETEVGQRLRDSGGYATRRALTRVIMPSRSVDGAVFRSRSSWIDAEVRPQGFIAVQESD